MRTLLCLLSALTLLAGALRADEVKKVPYAELDELVLKSGALIINNINLVTEPALLGGTKATFQCSGKNKSKANLNYTIYVAAFDKAGTLLTCFGVEPDLNVHEAGKVEALEASGMVDPGTKGKIDHVLLKLVIQKESE